MQLCCSSVNRLYPTNALPSPHVSSYTLFSPTLAPETEGRVPAMEMQCWGEGKGRIQRTPAGHRPSPGLGRQSPSKLLPLLCCHFFPFLSFLHFFPLSFLSYFLPSFLVVIYLPVSFFCSFSLILYVLVLVSPQTLVAHCPWGTRRDGKPKYHSSSWECLGLQQQSLACELFSRTSSPEWSKKHSGSHWG